MEKIDIKITVKFIASTLLQSRKSYVFDRKDNVMLSGHLIYINSCATSHVLVLIIGIARVQSYNLIFTRKVFLLS